MLALLLALSAQAGVIEVTVHSPVVVSVDGVTLEYADDGNVAWSPPISGRHRVVVRSFTGKELWGGAVDVPAEQMVRCRWKNKMLDCYERVALPTSISMNISAGDAGAAVSMGVGGMGVSTSVTETSGGVSMNMGMTGMPGMGVGIAVTEPAAEAHVVHHHVMEAPQAAAPVQAVPDRVKLVVRSSDGEWADIVIDGKVVMELRNEDEMTVWISPGQHLVEIREFMEDDAYAAGRLDTGYTDTVTLGIAEGQPIRCYDHDGFRAQ